MMNGGAIITNSAPSIARVVTTTICSRSRTSPSSVPMFCCAKTLPPRPTVRVTARASSSAIVTIPRPPTWIATRMTTLPNGDQYVAVSTLVRPVTVTADAAVNTASCHGVHLPSADAMGRRSSTEKNAAAAAKISTAARDGDRRTNRPMRCEIEARIASTLPAALAGHRPVQSNASGVSPHPA